MNAVKYPPRDTLPEPSGGESPDGVQFLTSLLVRFPQLGSAHLLERGRLLQYEVYLRESPGESAFQEFSDDLDLSTKVLHDLLDLRPHIFRIRHERPHPSREAGGVGTLRGERDVASLTVEEISLTMALVSEHFGDGILAGERVTPDEAGYQEEMLRHCLERIRGQPQETKLIGFRDEMRVLVYADEA